MKVRHCSDIHLEFGLTCKKNQILPKGGDPGNEVLLVDGDFVATDYLRFNRTDPNARSVKKMVLKHLEWMSEYKNVYFTMGNHEHYQGDILESYNILTAFIQHHGFKNMKVLEDDSVELAPGVYLLGCTLWTDMNKNNPLTHMLVGEYMNDFGRAIRHGSRMFSTKDAMAIHQRSLVHLGEMYHYLTYDFEKKKPDGKTQVIVMTHHHPSAEGLTTSYRHQGGNEENYGYFSDLGDWILDRPQISHWVVGHTHNPCDYQIGSCNVLSNPRGYGILGHKDACFDKFSVDKYVIEIGEKEHGHDTAQRPEFVGCGGGLSSNSVGG